MSATPIAMTVLLAVALGTFATLMRPRLRLLLGAKPTQRFDQVGLRLLGVLKFAVGQWRMPRDLVAGVAHIFIFSGFMVVSVATLTHFIHAYAPGFRLPGLVGDVYSLVKDIFQVLVLVGVSY